MKKQICLVMAAMMAAGMLAGCSGSAKETTAAATEAATTAEETKAEETTAEETTAAASGEETEILVAAAASLKNRRPAVVSLLRLHVAPCGSDGILTVSAIALAVRQTGTCWYQDA